MCMCGKPTINGEPGYSWDGKDRGVRQPNPPALAEGDVLLFDEPGRCGGLDAHCHHFRLVKGKYGGLQLLVRHGGDDERIKLTCVADLVVKAGTLAAMDTHARYWLLHTIYSTQRESADKAKEKERYLWSEAAAEKRIKTRKDRGRGSVKVWIEPPAAKATANA